MTIHQIKTQLDNATDFAHLKVGSSLTAMNIKQILANPFPPLEHILAPWLTTQSLSMIYAWRGIGKTHIALGIGYAVAAGCSFLVWNAPKPRGVLYIDGEMPGIAMQERLARIAAANPHEFDPELFRIVKY